MRKLRIQDEPCKTPSEAASLPGLEPHSIRTSLCLFYYLLSFLTFIYSPLSTLSALISLSIIYINFLRGSIVWGLKFLECVECVLYPNVLKFRYKLHLSFIAGWPQGNLLISVCFSLLLYTWELIVATE